jgi:hypothetical protein
VTATLPPKVQQVFDSYVTTEYTTIDGHGQPITWPVTPYYRPGEPCIDVTTGLGYPKKARDAAANPRVALLFSEPAGSGMERSPFVLVQGTADVDDRDLEANRARYQRESLEKLPATGEMMPPGFLRPLFTWYLARIYVHVRPERVYVWPDGDLSAEPTLLDSHLEEIRSGHSEEPEQPQPEPENGGPTAWDRRIEEMGSRYDTVVLSLVAPDGFPFSQRVAVQADGHDRRLRLQVEPVATPLRPGRACVTAHDHAPDFTWQRNFQVRGDLVRDGDGWSVIPRKLIGGFELPPTSTLGRYRANAAKIRRYRKIAKRELAARKARG